MNLKNIPLFCAVSALAGQAFAAAMYSTPGATLSDNFNASNFAGMSTGSTAAWVDNSTVPNWYADNRATDIAYQYGGGVSSTTTMYGYKFDADGNVNGDASSLGTRSSSSDPWGFGWAIQNNTGSVLTEFTLEYDAFVSSYEGDTGPDGYTLTYQLGGAYQDDGFASSVTGANYVAPINQTDAAGNPVVATTGISGTVSGINWLPGQTLWIHWQDTSAVSGESTYGMGIDNVSITAIPEPSTLILVGLSLGAVAFFRRRKR